MAGLQVPGLRKYPPAGGGLWRGRFKFKNAARPMDRAQGAYFDSPVEIVDVDANTWLREKTPAMAELPEHLVEALEALIGNPQHGAKLFA